MLIATDKANKVILELLDYSAPHELSMEPRNINEVIEKVLNMTRHNFTKAHVIVSQNLSDDLPLVAIDESKLDQVFINLLLNAIGAMPSGGQVDIRSYCERMTATGDNVSSKLTELFNIGDPMVIVEIADTGSGIDHTHLAKIFEPFFSTKTTGQGTGLGLSVTKSIVDMHRGLITLENIEGDATGVRVRLYFPTVSPHEP